MKLEILNITLFRTPAFSTEDILEEKWQELKSMIAETSASFYEVVNNLKIEELNTVNEKVRFSIWKYFNRAKYRATPFASFAGFSIVKIATNNTSPVILNSKLSAHKFIDWKEKDTYAADMLMLVKHSTCFQANSSIYMIGDEIRYIRFRNGCFEVAAIKSFPQLKFILSLCREKTDKKKIFECLKSDCQMQVSQINDMLEQMLGLQLLLTEQYTNITGEDYFKRLDRENFTSNNTYTISERNLLSGSIDIKKLKTVPDLIKFLSVNLPDTINSNLSNFRSAFLRKFEQNVVPLSVAMDIETGVGYGNFGNFQEEHQITDILDSIGNKESAELQISYTDLHRFLLNGLIKRSTIKLEDFKGTKKETTYPLPNTFSVLFHFWKGHPVIESVGGCTANGLLGRFTLASSELEKFGQEIASIEEKANPDILFFDIAYQAEKQVDNVNRRKRLYQHELPILSWSCDPSPIHLNDILVTVRGTEIILWSKKYGKRMVPRIPSAYNYTRSDLAVYRFLCDLQHQHIKSDLNLKIQHFFPGLSYYPRVNYKDVILSPAMWKMPQEIVQVDKIHVLDKQRKNLVNWLDQEGINFLFQSGHADQLLCFDPKINADIDAFLLYCRQNTHKEIYISEALITDEDSIQDENGKKYAAQIIANYSHPNPIYYGYTSLNSQDCPVNNTILPGDNWLYFEVYCHPSRSNELLLNAVTVFLKEIKKDILEWFFIRYDDPKPHIRLRLQLKEPSQGYLFISKLKILLEPYFRIGQVSDLQIKTYFRETERYGADRICLVEKWFFTDSKYALYLLVKAKTLDQLYATTLTVMQKLLTIGFSAIKDQILFVKNMADHFKNEFDINNEIFKKMNLNFQELKEKLESNIISSAIKLTASHEKILSKILNSCSNKEERTKLVADLLHMHVNRLFYSNQRIHEAILYQYLLKLLKAQLLVPAFQLE